MNRIYIICYNFYESCGGSFKYAANPKFEAITEFFTKQERDKFISRYLYLSDAKRDIHIGELNCYIANPTPIVDMEAIINAI